MAVPPSAATAATNREAIRIGHIKKDLSRLSVLDERSGRNGQIDIRAVFAVLFTAHTVFAVLRNKLSLITVSKQGIRSLIYREDHVTASTAVTTIRTAGIDVFFAMEGNGACAAVSRLYVQFNIINKHIFSSF
jgi:hypothetical protein